jgi:hypothetical protein
MTTHLRLLPGTSLHQQKVLNTQGQQLGEIVSVVIDSRHGQIIYIVFNPFIASQSKASLVVIAWENFLFDPTARHFVLETNLDQILEAPKFEKNNWTKMCSPDFIFQLEVYSGN